MQLHGKMIVVCLGLATLWALSGCGKGEANQPAAAINGAEGEQSQTAEGGSKSKTGKAAVDRTHPVVVFDTSLGSITVELDAKVAPLTVDNFLAYVGSGHYDQTIFHQVFKGQCVLGGAYTAELVEKPTRPSIRNEAHNGLKNQRGTIAMARQLDGIDSATCQFFFNVANNEVLDHKDRTPEGYGYCVFGRVTSGLDVLDKIDSVAVENMPKFQHKPVETVLIKSVRRSK